ncbi:four helix bundle protein [Sediminibacterium sp.]|uniref:four helix bundle protein n=1 Tax=Sediminibacterium sp. TaxID=1917865 RepID=UPI0025DB97BB|nr:four helix bundle protein [Sediminibacterium sp.]MBW0176932.1 four helix bundle protein [Sediminibacterium sp.]
MERKFDLEQRLIKFSVSAIRLAEKLPTSFAGKHLSGQLIRSATAPALNYGEAQSAESRNDFIHKLKIALRELRETKNNLLIIHQMEWYKDNELNAIVAETIELISIFSKSITTTQKNKTAKT